MGDVSISETSVPMRDGATLHTRVYVGAGDQRRPTLLRRTPYPWDWMGAEAFDGPNAAWCSQGFAVVAQYCRGRFGSTGEFEPFRVDVEDGYDAIDWIVQQPWSNGKVGMWGISYEGAVQNAALIGQHPALVCVVPQSAPRTYHDGSMYHSPGVLSLAGAMSWALQVASEHQAEQDALTEEPAAESIASDLESGNEIYQMYADAAAAGWSAGLLEMSNQMSQLALPLIAERPARDIEMMRLGAPFWARWLEARTPDDPYWSDMSIAGRPECARPALFVSGWYDLFLRATLAGFAEWSADAPTPELRSAQRMVIGPWGHGLSSAQWAGHVGATPELEQFQHPDIARFLQRWLHDDRSTLDGTAPIRLYVIGDNGWRDEWEWPLARTQWTSLFLSSGGHANSRSGDGRLSWSTPVDEPADTFTFDPSDPVPAVGGPCLPGLVLPGPGAFDQSEVEDRRDVLVYSSDVLSDELEVTGPVRLRLWAASSAPDTDFVAKVVDVFPDGQAVNVCQGIVRTSCAGSPSLTMRPDVPVRLCIDMAATSYVLQEGHRLRLEVTSSCFPLYDVNPNTGRHYVDDDTTEVVTAEQAIHHDRRRPSHLVLPLIPRPKEV